MKNLLFILLVPAALWANPCPKYEYPENHKLADEMANLCQAIKAVPNGTYKGSSMTLQGITVDSITVNSSGVGNFQVSMGSATVGTATTSGSYVATNLSANITPLSSSHRIKISVQGLCQTGTTVPAYFTLKRGSTDLGNTNGMTECLAEGGTVSMVFAWIDSPSTTANTTYTLYIKSSNGTTTVTFLPDTGFVATMILEEVR